MALTNRQKIVAQAPFHGTRDELLEVMTILSDPTESEVFASDQWGVMVGIERAANNRKIPIPHGFQEVLDKVVAPQATHRREMDYHSPSWPAKPE